VSAAAQALRATEADRAALAEVLARPEFRDRRLDGAALRRLLLDAWERLLELLGTAEAERYASLGRLAFFLAVLAALLLAWRAAHRRAARRRRAAAPAAAAPTIATAPATARAADAERALAAGDAPGAVRAAFAAAAAALARRGLTADAGEALTGRELSAAAGDAGFAELARLHERTVFGRRPVAAEEARRSIEVARRLAGETP
jgi:hypothetical protein